MADDVGEALLSVTARCGSTAACASGVVTGSDPRHVSAQVAMTCVAPGLVEFRPLPVTLPLQRIVGSLNDYQPDVLHGYASYLALLADEQRAGRLRIAPRLVTSGSELLTADMARRVKAAFGVAAFDFYSVTEGLWAAQCTEHAGFHHFGSSASSRMSMPTTSRCHPASWARGCSSPISPTVFSR